MILNNLYEKVAIWITDFGKWPPFIYESFWSLCSGKVCEIKYLISVCKWENIIAFTNLLLIIEKQML